MYPIKSGRANEIKEANCTEEGLREIDNESRYSFRDRCFLMYEETNYKCLNVLRYRKALLVSVTSANKENLIFEAPNFRELCIKFSSFTKSPKLVKIMMYDTAINAVDCGDEASVWISQYLCGTSEGIRLGYFMEDFCTRLNPLEYFSKKNIDILSFYENMRKADSGLFASLSSYMIINSASVDDINNKLLLEDRFTYANFRPNIVVRGCEKYAEDKWKWIKIGENVILRNFKPCVRCHITTINPITLEKNKNSQPFQILKTCRTVKQIKGHNFEGDSPVFGINAGLFVSGKIKIGDPVYINY
ncbi:hypothetical protein PGB90_009423 [Kerria lacca]